MFSSSEDNIDLWQGGLDFWQVGFDLQQVGLDLWQVGKIIKVALSAALEPAAARDLEPRAKLYLRTFPKKNNLSGQTLKGALDH